MFGITNSASLLVLAVGLIQPQNITHQGVFNQTRSVTQ